MSDQVTPGTSIVLKQHHRDIIEKYGGKRGERLLMLAAGIQVATPAIKWGLGRIKRRDVFTITVPGIDDIYPDLHEWVLDRIPAIERKAMIASTKNSKAISYVNDDSDSTSSPESYVRLRYDGSRTQNVTIEGHQISVTVAQDEVPTGISISENWKALLEKITFVAHDVSGRDAVVRMIDDLVQKKYAVDRPPALMIPSRYGGGWNRRGDLPPRTLDSIVLKQGQLEHLVNDLDTFLKAENEYNMTCQPWHRGYLFHGAPRTGKTSVARALANHFNMTTYYLPLGDLNKDADLMSLVSAIEPRSILLLEDVDAFHATTERTDEKDKTSVAAMLNALDGVWTPHGLVTIMTTNNRDRLDPALIQAGRIDVDEEFTVLDEDQARRLSKWFCGEYRTSVSHQFVGQSPATLIEALREQQHSKEITP